MKLKKRETPKKQTRTKKEIVKKEVKKEETKEKRYETFLRLRKLRLQYVKTWKSRKGKRDLIDILSNKKVTSLRRAINAMCYDCVGGGDGKEDLDCTSYSCPLYAFNHWQTLITKTKRTTKKISEEHKQKLMESLKNAREKRTKICM